MVNVFQPDLEYDPEDPPGFRAGRDKVGARTGATRLGASVYHLSAGQAVCPYHWHSEEEELLIALTGAPSVRTPTGWTDLAPGDVVAFPVGEEGTHQIANRSGADATILIVSNNRETEICGYPDSGKIGVYGPMRALFREGEAVDYYDGETPP